MHCPLVVNLKTEWFIAVGVNLFLGSSTYVRTYIHPAINNASRLSLKTTFREWVRIAVDKAMEQPDNTHLIRKGKHHCMANLLFNWIGFSCFACVELDRDLQLWLNPNQSNRRSAIQFYFQLTKYVSLLWNSLRDLRCCMLQTENKLFESQSHFEGLMIAKWAD